MQLRKCFLVSISAFLVISSNIVNTTANANTGTDRPITIKRNEMTMGKISINNNENSISKNQAKIDNNNNSVKNDTNSSMAKKQKIHIVENGENIYRISLKYNIKQSDLIKLNNIKNNFIKVGQTLILPENAIDNEKPVGTNEKADINNNNLKKEEKTTNGPNNNKISNSKNILVKPDNYNDKKEDAGKNQTTQTIHQSTFIWPVRGVVVSKFGSIGKNNVMLEGNNIATEKDAVVRASSSGVISYNDKVEGYDNVVLIKHYNGFFTAYGHIDSMVNVGDKVIKGQVIGYVRPTANSKRSILYFSVRKQNKSYDPEKIIQSKIDD